MSAADRGTNARTIGRYRLYDAIASGGMAVVHVGRMLGTAGFARTVAIKRLHAQLAKDPEFVAMLLDEARLAVRVRHPNVAAVLDIVSESDELCLVLDYVEGESLSRLVARSRELGEPVPTDIVISIMLGVLYGLHAAHTATGEDARPLDLVHRDVSPQNVIVGVDGIARVIDFGVAKATARLQTTGDGELKGKLGYMAPEQLAQKGVDARTDIFAAGVVLWEALTARRLFLANDLADVAHRAFAVDVLPPSRLVPEITPVLDAVAMKALALRREDRFESAAAMAAALARCGAAASPQEVATWVKRLGGDGLARRIARVAAIERGDGDAEGDPSGVLAVTAESPTAGPHSLPTLPLPSSVRSRRSVARVVVALAVITAVAFAARDLLRAPAPRVEGSAPASAPSAPIASAAVDVPGVPSARESAAPAAVDASPAAATSAPEAPARATAIRRPTAPSTPTSASGAPSSSAAPSAARQRPDYCHGKQAFDIGPDGIERPKRECL